MSKQFKNIAGHLKYSQYDINTHISNKNLFQELKKFGTRTWCKNKPFGHQVAHNRYLLTSCPGHINLILTY